METLHTLTTADRVSIAYRYQRSAIGAAGNAPLVLIHGAASNMTRWSEFIEQTTLASTRDILRLDLRGHGQSLYRGAIGLEIWCDDIAAILRQENHRRALLMGHCLGANIAIAFAARYPQQAAGLVLVEPMLREALAGRLQRLRQLALPFKIVIAVIRAFNRIGIYRRHLHTLDLRVLDEEFRSRLVETGDADFLAQHYASPWQDLKLMPSANFLQDILEINRSLPLAKISAPFVALLSTGRGFVDPNITAALLEPLPGGEIHSLEAEHWIPTEQPQAMRAAIEQWVTTRGKL